LIEQADRKAAAEEDVLEAFAAVGSSLPSLGELTEAAEKDEGELPGVDGDLVEDIGVVAVQGLAGGGGLFWVEGARGRDDLAPDGEAALLLDD
jgi:hypothetical protein